MIYSDNCDLLIISFGNKATHASSFGLQKGIPNQSVVYPQSLPFFVNFDGVIGGNFFYKRNETSDFNVELDMIIWHLF